jgi:hypothetical protein
MLGAMILVPTPSAWPVLPAPAWRQRAVAHRNRVLTWTGPHRERATRGEKHPVYDFLFTYYAFRPAWLERWHPGPGLVLAGEEARDFLRDPAYHETPEGVTLDLAALPPKRRAFVTWLYDFLVRVRDRPPLFGCSGWHEWAMVYRQTPEEIRHHAWPLRHPPEELAAIVERAPLVCTHFDAFRFFTPAARPLNRHQPTREDAPALEQAGCLHANMDLYKWATKLGPWIPAELVADCFALARDIRELDMRASPYDLRPLGFDPVPVETPAGRAEYEAAQRAFTARAAPLRERLIQLCSSLLTAAGPGTAADPAVGRDAAELPTAPDC